MKLFSNCVMWRPHLQATVSVFIFIGIYLTNQVCDGSGYGYGYSVPIRSSSSTRRVGRQLGFGGFGALGNFLQPQPYSNRQQNAEVNFFQSLLSMNFDISEVMAMYRNVTAVAVTPGCFGQCRTPMALYMIQSFYPCYSLKKTDCPKGLVCCMQDPSTRLASANTIHDVRVKATPPISSDETGEDDRYRVPLPQKHASSVAVAASSQSSTKAKPEDNQPLFNEEYYKNNFIQDEIPE